MKNRNFYVLVVAFLLGSLVSIPISNVSASQQQAAAVSGYRLPWIDGLSVTVSGDGTTHNKNDALGDVPRHALDFPLNTGSSVLAMRDGKNIQVQYNAPGGGHLVVVETSDNLCMTYLHLSSVIKTSGTILRGEEIGKSGVGAGTEHLHVSVYSKQNTLTNCLANYNAGQKLEHPIIFDESNGNELKRYNPVTSVNQGSRVWKVAFHALSISGSNKCKITAIIYGIKDTVGGKTTNASGNIWAKALENGVWNCSVNGCDKNPYTAPSKTISLADRVGGAIYSYKFRIGVGGYTTTPRFSEPFSLNLTSACKVN